MESISFNSLPDDCISKILSLTTPRDVCRCSPISLDLRIAGFSNVAWEKFLPSDYQNILSGSVFPMHCSSKKELYFRLCDSVLIEGGKKNFWLEKSTGKKCYMLSASDLSIPWGNDSLHWSWKPLAQSRFPEVAELRTISWLEIQGEINARILSPKTKYAAYLVLKIADRAYGLNAIPSEISVEVGDQISAGTAYMQNQDTQKQNLGRLLFSNRMEVLKSRLIEGDQRIPCDRKDGWMEIELGEFFIDGGDEGEIKMSLKEIKGQQLKGGLIIEGIEVRPKE
ncbi:hypothetical protein IFM89_001385 [Coptis chinensis]|uniref:F-box domain-containing protein n=1 Tax=Coptis chinensis TaxID=261450 RepID=A0A835HNB0_9MAGN|nr:hypothetical protein IFM89_001385 [Coptis chinensis]